MKQIVPFLMACALVVPAFAQDTKTTPAPAAALVATVTNEIEKVFPVSAGLISAPFVLNDGCLSQTNQNDIATDGKAVYLFNVTEAGDYIIKGMVNAPSEEENSLFVNVDAQPEDPLAIWGIEVTTGFQERIVNWRGEDEAVPKKFKLATGTHKLIIIGREPNTQLKSLSIVAAPK